MNNPNRNNLSITNGRINKEAQPNNATKTTKQHQNQAKIEKLKDEVEYYYLG